MRWEKFALICIVQIWIAPPGFEPRSQPPEGWMIGHYTTGLIF